MYTTILLRYLKYILENLYKISKLIYLNSDTCNLMVSHFLNLSSPFKEETAR